MPLTFFASPVVAFATHSSMPSLRVFRKASFDPSGENLRLDDRFAFAGTVTLAGTVATPVLLELRLTV